METATLSGVKRYSVTNQNKKKINTTHSVDAGRLRDIYTQVYVVLLCFGIGFKKNETTYLTISLRAVTPPFAWLSEWLWFNPGEHGRMFTRLLNYIKHTWWRHQKHFPRYRSPVNSPHKGQWRGTLMFSLICALHKRFSKQSWGWWFKMSSRSLWRHCNEIKPKEDRVQDPWGRFTNMDQLNFVHGHVILHCLLWNVTSNGSWCMGIKGEMSGTVCVTFTWYMYIYMSCL